MLAYFELTTEKEWNYIMLPRGHILLYYITNHVIYNKLLEIVNSKLLFILLGRSLPI